MTTKTKFAKGAFVSALLSYLLIAFEFFYMAGPFAAYFYSVYSPALNFFNSIRILSWLNQFFYPHAVRETASAFIDAHEVIGVILAVGGFLAFCIGACQVYYAKIAKKGVVTGGIYNYVRHPQYISFMICSLGLLFLWPRFICAVMFVTMIFAYYLLAKIEERECTAKFGESYVEYMGRTHMFFPFSIKLFERLHLPKKTSKKVITLLVVYMASLLVILGLAKELQTLSIDSLYAVYTDNAANISVCALSEEKMHLILDIVNTDRQVKELLSGYDPNTRYINYILPQEWYAAEIPMNDVELRRGHSSPDDYNRNLFKVILTKAVPRDGELASTKDLLTNLCTREPIAEIWIDLSTGIVTEVRDMPEDIRYEGIPTAVF